MLLNTPDIRYCLEKAEEISEIYRMHVLNSGATRRSIREFLRMCTEYLGKKIELKELLNVQAQDNSIRGYYLSFGDRYEICLLAGMNFCWRRFVACKELFHVILDDERYRTTDIYNHVEEVIAKFPVAVMAGSAVVSEALAEIAAMEFLFPYPDRRRILTAGSPDYLAIAQRYKIPQALVEEYLVDSFVKGLEPYMVKKQ